MRMCKISRIPWVIGIIKRVLCVLMSRFELKETEKQVVFFQLEVYNTKFVLLM